MPHQNDDDVVFIRRSITEEFDRLEVRMEKVEMAMRALEGVVVEGRAETRLQFAKQKASAAGWGGLAGTMFTLLVNWMLDLIKE